MRNVSEDRVEALKIEAGMAGDHETVELCNRWLDYGPEDAPEQVNADRRTLLEIFRNARG